MMKTLRPHPRLNRISSGQIRGIKNDRGRGLLRNVLNQSFSKVRPQQRQTTAGKHMKSLEKENLQAGDDEAR